MDNVEEICDRLHKYYTSESSVETDLNKTKEALEGFIKAVSLIKLNLNKKLVVSGENGPVKYLASYRLPYPDDLTTAHMILIRGGDVFSNSIFRHLTLAFCLGHPNYGSSITGMFAKDGIMHLPTLFIYVPMENLEYGFNQVARKTFIDKLDKISEIRRTYVHEMRHYTDWVESLIKNPTSDMLRGYRVYVQPPADVARIKPAPGTTHSFATYVNHNFEINARYAEWLIDILYSFDKLEAVKEGGILRAFPKFQMFWDWMWAHYAPEELIEHATPKVKKYLQKRLYKFYVYVLNLENPPATRKDAQALIREYLERDRTDDLQYGQQ